MFDVYLKIHNAYFAGRRDEAITLHNAILPMLNHIRQNVERIILYEKRILQRRGLIASEACRLPGFTPDRYFDALFETYSEQLSPLFEKV